MGKTRKLLNRLRERNKDNERGAALLEFAFIAPILIMLVVGIVQFGLVLNQTQGLHAAAREGARAAAIPDTDVAEIESAVNGALNGVATRTLQIDVTPSTSNTNFQPCDGREGDQVTVTVKTDFVLDIPFFAGRTIDIAGEGVFRCEG